jgi:hypothetical protein
MRQLGLLDEWLDATARAGGAPAVAFSSLFPFSSDALFAPPPATLWPPPAAQVTAPSPVFLTKLRWNAARLVPVSLVETILLGQSVLADQWLPDAQTGCLLRRDRPNAAPFRLTTRTAAAVDRASNAAVQAHATACVEFEPGAGLWGIVRFLDDAARDRWQARIKGAFGLLADTGFGGRRSSGWGQTQAPDFQTGTWPGVLMPKLARRLQTDSYEATGHWLLSLYSPNQSDTVDWSAGDYSLAVRGGFVFTNGHAKKLVRLVTEGSVLASFHNPVGAAVDTAPDGAPHPAYRAGFAIALRLPVIEIAPPKSAPAPEPEVATEPEAAMPVTGEPEAGIGPEPEPEPEIAPEPERAPEGVPEILPSTEPEVAPPSEPEYQPPAEPEPEQPQTPEEPGNEI